MISNTVSRATAHPAALPIQTREEPALTAGRHLLRGCLHGVIQGLRSVWSLVRRSSWWRGFLLDWILWGSKWIFQVGPRFSLMLHLWPHLYTSPLQLSGHHRPTTSKLENVASSLWHLSTGAPSDAGSRRREVENPLNGSLREGLRPLCQQLSVPDEEVPAGRRTQQPQQSNPALVHPSFPSRISACSAPAGVMYPFVVRTFICGKQWQLQLCLHFTELFLSKWMESKHHRKHMNSLLFFFLFFYLF